MRKILLQLTVALGFIGAISAAATAAPMPGAVDGVGHRTTVVQADYYYHHHHYVHRHWEHDHWRYY